MKLLGSALILSGGCGAVWRRLQERRLRRDTLGEMLIALRQMAEEIRLTRTPMPRLLRQQGETCVTPAGSALLYAAKTACAGEELSEAWRRAVEALPLNREEQSALLQVTFRGDEEKVCGELRLASERLALLLKKIEDSWSGEMRRTVALWLSGAAMIVILLF